MVSVGIKAATRSLTDIAERLGVSRHTVRSWSIGRTTPNAANLADLADYFDEQAVELQRLAKDLRRSAPE